MGWRGASIVCGGLIMLAACARASAGYRPSPSERSAIRAQLDTMLARAASNWNRGDLDAFVEDYLPSDSTTFIGSRGLVRGPSAIRAGYAPLFAPAAVRDSLSFDVLDVDPIAPDVVHLIGTYTLARRVGSRDSVTSRGPTSLVLRRVDGRWRIVHDHSS